MAQGNAAALALTVLTGAHHSHVHAIDRTISPEGGREVGTPHWAARTP